MVSIHAPTRGATSTTWKGIIRGCGFNPRTHTGCDQFRVMSTLRVKVSIHAPTRGATKVKLGNMKVIKVSIHAPTRGATLAEFLFLFFV